MLRKLVPLIISANCVLWSFLLWHSFSLILIHLDFGNTSCPTDQTILDLRFWTKTSLGLQDDDNPKLFNRTIKIPNRVDSDLLSLALVEQVISDCPETTLHGLKSFLKLNPRLRNLTSIAKAKYLDRINFMFG